MSSFGTELVATDDQTFRLKTKKYTVGGTPSALPADVGAFISIQLLGVLFRRLALQHLPNGCNIYRKPILPALVRLAQGDQSLRHVACRRFVFLSF